MIQSINKYSVDEIIKKDAPFYYVVPKYQSEYAWSVEEWYALYDDIIENQEGYFIGSIICINKGDSIYPCYEVIDGQQRLTTLCLFLLAIYRRLNEHKDEMEEDDLFEISWIRKALQNSRNSNGLILLPQVQNSNQDDFLTVMYENGILKYAKKVPFYGLRRIARCFNNFLYKLDQDLKECDDKVAKLLEIKRKVCKTEMITIEVSSLSDAYKVYESLNNQGTPIKRIDLMKNIIMARADKAGLMVDDSCNQWKELMDVLTDDYATQERFFRYYYNAFKNKLNGPFRKDKNMEDTLGIEATKNNLIQIYEELISHDVHGLLDDLLRVGHIFADLRSMVDDGTQYRKALIDLNRIKGDTSHVLLMFLLRNKNELELGEDTIISIINLLVLFFVRQRVTYFGWYERSRFFMNIINQIETESIKGEVLYDTIKSILATEVASDDRFIECLNYHFFDFNWDTARYILCAVAQKYMTADTWTDLWTYTNDAKTNKKVFTWELEHILPEDINFQQDWVDMIAGGDRDLYVKNNGEYANRLGNMTISGYSSDLCKYSFEQKRDRVDKEKRYIGYKNGLEINKDLALKERWTIEDIKNRTEKLAKEVAEMFKFPE